MFFSPSNKASLTAGASASAAAQLRELVALARTHWTNGWKTSGLRPKKGSRGIFTLFEGSFHEMDDTPHFDSRTLKLLDVFWSLVNKLIPPLDFEVRAMIHLYSPSIGSIWSRRTVMCVGARTHLNLTRDALLISPATHLHGFTA